MLDKIKELRKHPLVQSLKDVRAIGLVMFGIIALLVTWSGIGAIQTNYELQKQLARLEEQNKVSELENANLRLKNEYYETEEFLELQARKLGRAAPGETMILVPRHVALARTIDTSEELEVPEKDQPAKPRYQQNFEAWMRFFLNRPS